MNVYSNYFAGMYGKFLISGSSDQPILEVKIQNSFDMSQEVIHDVRLNQAFKRN
eukprot:403372490